jgi:hypothetical protein
MFPLALITDPNRLDPVIVPVALIKPVVRKLPPVILAALLIVPVADIAPAVQILPPVISLVVVTGPVNLARLPVSVGK